MRSSHRQLAGGAHPRQSAELRLRAERLGRPRPRFQLAKAIPSLANPRAVPRFMSLLPNGGRGKQFAPTAIGSLRSPKGLRPSPRIAYAAWP